MWRILSLYGIPWWFHGASQNSWDFPMISFDFYGLLFLHGWSAARIVRNLWACNCWAAMANELSLWVPQAAWFWNHVHNYFVPARVSKLKATRNTTWMYMKVKPTGSYQHEPNVGPTWPHHDLGGVGATHLVVAPVFFSTECQAWVYKTGCLETLSAKSGP